MEHFSAFCEGVAHTAAGLEAVAVFRKKRQAQRPTSDIMDVSSSGSEVCTTPSPNNQRLLHYPSLTEAAEVHLGMIWIRPGLEEDRQKYGISIREP